MADRTQAEESSAYSQPPTVVVKQPSHTSASSAEERIKQLDKLAAGGYITPEEYQEKEEADPCRHVIASGTMTARTFQ